MASDSDNDQCDMDVDEASDCQPCQTNEHEAHIRPRHTTEGRPILFYGRDRPYYEFTNFSYHPIWWEGRKYPTAEHLFQALKFLPQHPNLADEIRHLPTPRAALQEATRLQHLRRPDWFDVNIAVMDSILEEKFAQHPDLRRRLLETGNCELIEASPVDSFWGAGSDGQGRNELGKALMRLRAKMHESAPGHRRPEAHDT